MSDWPVLSIHERRVLGVLVEKQKTTPTYPLTLNSLVTGSNHEDATVYTLIEAAGCVIVGEDHDWGDLELESSADETLPALAALAARPQTRPFAGPNRSSAERTRALAERAAALRVDGVIHCRIAGDEASPWDLKTLRQALESLDIPVLSLTSALHPSPDAATARSNAARGERSCVARRPPQWAGDKRKTRCPTG